jgi:hypothetical protein
MADLDNTSDDGGLPVAGGQIPKVTATWTSATAGNTTLSIATIGYSSVLFSWQPTGTISGGVLTFEESLDGGTTWISFPVQNLGLVANYSPTFGLSGQTNTLFQADIGGATNFRIRLSTVISGTGSGVVNLTATAFPQSPIISNVLAQGINGNNTTTVSFNADYEIALPAEANAADPSWTEGMAVLSSVTLQGYQRVLLHASDLCVSTTAATGVGVTATLPAVAGAFHYISEIYITKYFTVANAASATPLVVTTTNLPGSLAFSFGQPLGTIGTTDVRIEEFSRNLKSSVVNTATTIVCPATTGIIWRVNVVYYAAP